MKQNITRITGAALLGLFSFAAISLHAQTTNLVTITATATVQNPNTKDNGTNTTTPAPTTLTVDTKKILALLAVGEGGEGNYTNTTFPSGAKLALLPDTGNGPIFAVLGKTNNVLIPDVSDILSFTPGGNYQAIVQSGKTNDNTPLSSTTNQQIVTVTYDDTSAGGNLQFSLSGVEVSTITDVAVKKSTTKYLEMESDSATGMSGDGNDTDTNSNVNPLVITGSFTAAGSTTLTVK